MCYPSYYSGYNYPAYNSVYSNYGNCRGYGTGYGMGYSSYSGYSPGYGYSGMYRAGVRRRR